MTVYYREHPRERYFMGDCAAFAVQLAHITGLPLGAVVDRHEGRTVLVHAFVYLPEDGEILVGAGLSCLESVLAEFPHSEDAWHQRVNVDELMDLAYGRAAAPDKEQVIRDVREMLREEEIPAAWAALGSTLRP